MKPGVPATPDTAPAPLSALFSYGLFGLPLAMVALPIYVYLPQFYAQRAGLSLALIGAVLLVARIAAAFIDPLLGTWIERGQARRGYASFVGLSLPLLLAGFAALFHPPALSPVATMAWFLGTLMLVYLGFSIATIAHQSWGAALTQAPGERARVTGVREACGLAGVVLAAGVTAQAGYAGLLAAFTLALIATAMLLLTAARRPGASHGTGQGSGHGITLAPKRHDWLAPLRQAHFRALFAVLLVNGVASAIPATLFLFFVADRLGLAPLSGLFLILYFGAAAASMALWMRAAARLGEARAWTGAMLLAAAIFVWAFFLPAGAAMAFGAICILSGLVLGADLALPPALLAGVIARAGHAGAREAAYFGLWNWGVQIALALAAGIALPLLGRFGYVPGQSAAGTSAVTALAAAYALLPCALKLVAASMLWRAPLRAC